MGTVLSGHDCTVFLISESENGIPFDVEDFIADGIIELDYLQGERKMVRNLTVLKMRGIDYKSGPINFNIDSNGLTLYPKIAPVRPISQTDFKEKRKRG
ncbi:MAG: RAD55 family ATPase [Candidatus Hadarchaeota archaeon]